MTFGMFDSLIWGIGLVDLWAKIRGFTIWGKIKGIFFIKTQNCLILLRYLRYRKNNFPKSVCR